MWFRMLSENLMAETLLINQAADKAEQYQSLLPQIKALVADEPDSIANLANVAAALKEALSFFWVGFYRVEGQQLVLGPFQGPIACTRIAYGEGVCGAAWQQQQTIIVEDVNAFPGHIACSSASQSEIVIPIFKDREVVMVLDVDSDRLGAFDAIDQQYLEALAEVVGSFL